MPNPFLQAVGKENFTTEDTSSKNPFLDALNRPSPIRPIDTPKAGALDIIKGLPSAAKNLYGSLFKKVAPAYTAPFEHLVERGGEHIITTKDGTIAEKTATSLNVITAAVGTLFTPITAIFEEANKIPELQPAVEIATAPFVITGITGEFIADRFVDVLPISKESKDTIRPAFQEAGGLAGMIWLGGKSMEVIMKGEPLTKPTVKELVTEAKIVNETPKIEPPKVAPKALIIPKVTDTLAKEAKKYKTAEEFVRGQMPNNEYMTVYHRTNTPIREFGKTPIYSKENKGEFFVSNRPNEQITGYGDNVIELRVKKSALEINDEFPSGEKHFTISTKTADEAIKTKSQLTDIYNQATKKATKVTDNLAKVEASPFMEAIKKLEVPKVEAPVTPETKPSGIAKSVETKAVEKGLIDKGYEELAGFDSSTIKTQAEIASQYSIEQIKRFATGEEPLPQGMKPATPFSIAEDFAMEIGDGVLARELLKSPIASQISEAASVVSLSRMRTPDSATAKMKEVAKTREKAVEKKRKGKSTEKIKSELKDSAKEQIKKSKPNKYDWNNFVDSIKC